MSIWTQMYGSLVGGWKTWGPNAVDGPGGFDSRDDPFRTVTTDAAMKLSAVWACMNLRAEVIGSLPLHLRDKDRNTITDHPLHSLLRYSPNSMQTASEFWSLQTAHLDMHGNALSVIERRRDKSVISLEPADPTASSIQRHKNGRPYYKIGTESYEPERVLHLRGFSMNAGWGLPRIDIGRQIIGAQLDANESAQRAFKQSLKLGGFFVPEISNPDPEQLKRFHKRLDEFGRPENNGKFLTLLKGMKPISGAEFRISPADTELLNSRYFGIEEICRLFNTPPQLIGHSDKASSWASSIEHINLFFLMYSLQPTFVRIEQRIAKSLLTPDDRAEGIGAKFNIQSLLRSDMKSQMMMFAQALQNGVYNRDEVRDLLDRPGIENGDVYTVQLNMGTIDQLVQQIQGAIAQ